MSPELIYFAIGIIELIWSMVLVICAVRLYRLARDMEDHARLRDWWIERSEHERRNRL